MIILKRNKKVVSFIFDLTDLSTDSKVCTINKTSLNFNIVS